MKVTEISGFWDARHPIALGDLKYIAYYYAKIEDRYVMKDIVLKVILKNMNNSQELN